MKQKASLALMEQVIMLLVFALAAALCLQAFLWADTHSLENTHRDRALIELQSAAEVLKQHKGDFSAAAASHGGVVENGVWTLSYSGDWLRSDADEVFYLRATPESLETDYLGGAALEITQADGKPLASLTVYWQEVQQ